MNKTQKDLVLEYLEENGSITTFECYEKLNIVDLQKAINLLRNEGYNITDRWIKKNNAIGKRIKFKKYILEKSVENDEETDSTIRDN